MHPACVAGAAGVGGGGARGSMWVERWCTGAARGGDRWCKQPMCVPGQGRSTQVMRHAGYPWWCVQPGLRLRQTGVLHVCCAGAGASCSSLYPRCTQAPEGYRRGLGLLHGPGARAAVSAKLATGALVGQRTAQGGEHPNSTRAGCNQSSPVPDVQMLTAGLEGRRLPSQAWASSAAA